MKVPLPALGGKLFQWCKSMRFGTVECKGDVAIFCSGIFCQSWPGLSTGTNGTRGLDRRAAQKSFDSSGGHCYRNWHVWEVRACPVV
jgi:hypothetical protein